MSLQNSGNPGQLPVTLNSDVPTQRRQPAVISYVPRQQLAGEAVPRRFALPADTPNVQFKSNYTDGHGDYLVQQSYTWQSQEPHAHTPQSHRGSEVIDGPTLTNPCKREVGRLIQEGQTRGEVLPRGPEAPLDPQEWPLDSTFRRAPITAPEITRSPNFDLVSPNYLTNVPDPVNTQRARISTALPARNAPPPRPPNRPRAPPSAAPAPPPSWAPPSTKRSKPANPPARTKPPAQPPKPTTTTAAMSDKDKFKYRVEIQQMMFVSGETGEPSAETTAIIEEIVRGQVIEMLLQCTQLAARRGSRSISTDDLIFLIRHDKAKVSRLRTYLSWKDVRKTAKDQDPAGGNAADPADLVDEATTMQGPSGQMMKQKKTKIGLPWEVASFYSEQAPEREDDEDEDEVEANQATLQRLKNADERTRGMTKDEYVHWSECRQASFTFRKGKRFREWAGFGTVTEAKPNDDIVDILGFLTFEIVQTLTEEALKVKEQEDKVAKAGKRLEKKRKREEFLFHAQEGRTPIEAKHVSEAFRRLQQVKPKSRAMKNFGGGVVKSRLSLV